MRFEIFGAGSNKADKRFNIELKKKKEKKNFNPESATFLLRKARDARLLGNPAYIYGSNNAVDEPLP